MPQHRLGLARLSYPTTGKDVEPKSLTITGAAAPEAAIPSQAVDVACDANSIRFGVDIGRKGRVERGLCQILQQPLGRLEIPRVEALGEPAIDLRQELSSLVRLPLTLPQSAQTHGRA